MIRKWKSVLDGDRCSLQLFLLANYIQVHNEQKAANFVTDEMQNEYQCYWAKFDDPICGRNDILKSICPNIYGMYYVKLALILILIGGVAKQDRSGVKIRGDSHLLLVGDPGTGKSQFLRYANKVSSRSVLTTGIGSTNAGKSLTNLLRIKD